MMRIVVDGIFFQLNTTGIARVWDTILRIMVARDDLEIFMLDRGRAPVIEGITNVPFPSYTWTNVAADSAMLQRMCDHLGADVFTSTYYSTPLTTPMVLNVYDMIPEIFGFDLSERAWTEKDAAILFASRYVSISHSTRKDLLKFYPAIDPDHVSVAHCGVDAATFAQRTSEQIAAFRKEQGLERPYFLFVGSRVQHMGYKNSDLFFNALRQMDQADFDVFCVGGEPEIEQSVRDSLPQGVRAKRVSLTDYELSLAYGGATALVYPSLYEGFGMPVIEAMAAGCPVITTHHGSLAEAAGEAAWLISGHSVEEMREALSAVQDPAVQADLRARGLAHIKAFRWEPMAEALIEAAHAAHSTAQTPAHQAFVADWARLRQQQADVDYI